MPSSAVTGVFTAPGSGPAVSCQGPFQFWVSGAFSGLMRLELSPDQGATWVATGDIFTAEGANASIAPERGSLLYRFVCVTLSSGAAGWGIA